MKRSSGYVWNAATLFGAAAFVAVSALPSDIVRMEASAQEKDIVVTGEGNDLADQQKAGSAGQEERGGTPTASGIFLAEQAGDEIAADRYLGRTIYNASDESLGDVNDLVFTRDGQLTAVVIGVGGFLGLGEKDVAVRFDAIEVMEIPETGEIQLSVAVTQEELEQAPEYVTAAQKLAERRAAEMEREQAQRDVLKPVMPEPGN